MTTEERRAYQREYQRVRRLKRIERIISFLGGKCVGCGGASDLEIHHKDPRVKSFDPGSRERAPEAMAKEIEKCELRCHVCHKDAHGRSAHGTTRMYAFYKCRCEQCVVAYRSWRNNYQKTRYNNDPSYRANLLEGQKRRRRERKNVIRCS